MIAVLPTGRRARRGTLSWPSSSISKSCSAACRQTIGHRLSRCSPTVTQLSASCGRSWRAVRARPYRPASAACACWRKKVTFAGSASLCSSASASVVDCSLPSLTKTTRGHAVSRKTAGNCTGSVMRAYSQESGKSAGHCPNPTHSTLASTPNACNALSCHCVVYRCAASSSAAVLCAGGGTSLASAVLA